MKLLLIVLFIIIISSSLFAQQTLKYPVSSFSQDELNYYNKQEKPKPDPWNVQNTILEVGFFTVAIIDFWQTYTFLYIDKNGSEKFCILGNHPSKTKFFIYTGIWGIMHPTISILIPNSKIRLIWQATTFICHFGTVMNNYQAGVRISI